MSRYIDADALIKAVEHMNFAQPFMEVARVIYGVTIEIANAPSIDIVRCKECKWCVEDDYIVKCWNIKGLNKTDGVVNPDDFCSYGEREGE